MKKLMVILTLIVFTLGSGMAAAYSIDPNSARAVEGADNILLWQTESGGWTKNTDFTTEKWQPGMTKGFSTVSGIEGGTFDNGATLDELRFLAAVFRATGDPRYRESFMKGLDWILAAQYPSGGWPQIYPLRNGYWDEVTFNDDAMVRVLTFIQEVLKRNPVYDFIPPEYFAELETAFAFGIDYILKSQIVVGGHLTAWCQQHDPFDYRPKMGRDYEHPSISGSESVGIVKFLMGLQDPSPEVELAILSALEWFDLAQLPGPTWARFYEIESNVPIFSGRNGIIRYRVEDIEEERQQGYSWSGSWPYATLTQAKNSGYLAELQAKFPLHTSITWEVFEDPALALVYFPHMVPQTRVREDLELHVEVKMRDYAKLEEMVLVLGGQEIYRGRDRLVKMTIPFADLEAGTKKLEVATTTTDGLQRDQYVNFTVVKPFF